MRPSPTAPEPQALAKTPPEPRSRGRRFLRSAWAIPLLVAAVALAVRLWVVLRGGGLHGYMSYDDGVYFAAATELLFGRLPYRDYVLLHPPGIALVLTPFAALGRVIGDRDAMAVARVAFMVLGAVNAGLTARVASVLGRRAALVAGGFMAVWVHAVYVDRTTVLEPVGTLAILVALLLLRPVRPRRQLRDAHAQVLAGVALGAGTCVKVWGVVPLGVVALALLLGRGWRAALRLALGAAAAGLLVVGPFLLAAPGATVRMIVLDQAGRPGFGWSPIERLPAIVGVVPYLSNEQRVAVAAVTAVVGPILVLLTALALRATAARLWVALLLANGLVLLAAPGYFPHYAAFLAVPLALVLGASAAVLSRRLRLRGSRPLQRAVAGAAVVTFVLLGLGTAAEPLGVRYPGERLAAFVPEDGCVRADDPSALIQLDVLSRNLRRGCTVPVDFSGITYDRLARERPDGSPVLREQNTAWQQYARDHLTSGSATVLIREEPGYDETTLRIFGSLPVLGRVGRWTVLGPPRAP